MFFDKEGVIEESSAKLIDVPDELVVLCLSKNGSQISPRELKEAMKHSRHWRNLKNAELRPLAFFMFDFNDALEIESFCMKIFKIEDDEELSRAVMLFTENVSKKSGFMKDEEDKIIICINSSSRDIKKTLVHALSHLVQIFANIRIVKDDKELLEAKKTSSIELALKSIGATFDDIIYYFSPREFNVHVDELAEGLLKTHAAFYSSKSKILFYIEDILPALAEKEKFKDTKFFKDYVVANNEEYAPLAMFLGAYLLKYKFQKIQNTLKAVFRNSFL